MIISHKYKYLFVEIPQTASTAISAELCLHYDGKSILYKHSLYHDFLKVATKEEKQYFVFCGIRNPLDLIVGRYFKLKTNHKEIMTTPKYWKRNGGWVPNADLERFRWIRDNDASFASYLKRYYKIPYDSLNSLDREQFDFVIRYENLQDDFYRGLELIGIEQKRPLPLSNKTADRESNFSQYFTPDTYDQAKAVFGPFMKTWGYDLPDDWGDSSIPRMRQAEFDLYCGLRNFYRKYWKREMGYGLPRFLQRGSRNF